MVPVVAALVLTCDSPRVYDGDTIACNSRRANVRLFGINAPELHPRQSGAIEARATLSSLTLGHHVTCFVQNVDRYGREVAICGTEQFDDVAKPLLLLRVVCHWDKYGGRHYDGYGLSCPYDRRPR